jgi:hypothetical protein
MQNQHVTFSQGHITASLIIQHLGWHLTLIRGGSWSVGIVLLFRIMYGGKLIPSANIANVAGIHIFS